MVADQVLTGGSGSRIHFPLSDVSRQSGVKRGLTGEEAWQIGYGLREGGGLNVQVIVRGSRFVSIM